jgi:glycosyltransferase involved in cell wall biosynthesis
VIVRIVYLHQYFNTPDMAGGTRSFEMARRLVARGHQVDLVTSSRDRGREGGWYTTVEAGIRVHWLPVPYDNKMSFGQRLRAFLKFAVAASRRAASLPADVVFATSTPLTIVFPGIYSAWRRRVPLVFEVRDLWPDVPIAMGVIRNPVAIWLARALERLAYRYSKHIVALAPGMRVDILGKGVAAHKVSVIPNGCDRGVFGVDHASAVAALRASRDWLGQRRLVLFGGTLGLANGVGYLVSIAEAMRRLDPEIRFVVIGDGAERAAIAELARHKGVLDQTFFMPGAMPKRELAVWLAACDMAVGLFSGPRVLWKDAVQNKFFDALAAGKPVACNFSGFQSELAVQHDVGLIFDAEDAELAARQMHAKLNDDAWLAAVRVRALRLAADDFDRDRLAERLGDVLDAAAKS